jgi:hypothetical protein
MMTKQLVFLCLAALALFYGTTTVVEAGMNMEESQEYLQTVCGLFQ